jgi:hypothetical protein
MLCYFLIISDSVWHVTLQWVLCPSLLLFEAMTLTVTMNVTAYDFGIRKNNCVFGISIHFRLGYVQNRRFICILIKKYIQEWQFNTFYYGLRTKADILYVCVFTIHPEVAIYSITDYIHNWQCWIHVLHGNMYLNYNHHLQVENCWLPKAKGKFYDL